MLLPDRDRTDDAYPWSNSGFIGERAKDPPHAEQLLSLRLGPAIGLNIPGTVKIRYRLASLISVSSRSSLAQLSDTVKAFRGQ